VSRSATLLSLLALLGGCGDSARSEPPVEDPAKDDRIVLKLVAEDFLRRLDLRGDGSKLAVWDTTEGLSAFITTGQLSLELKDRPPVSMELYNSLKARNGRMIALDPIDSKVVMMADHRRLPKAPIGFEESFRKAYPDAKAYAGFWLPAYSEDRAAALVRFSFGPTPHGACGTYFLEKSGGSWKIVWSKLSFYA
jgi:hypothetical protein